jgi:putative radical SAM enzyme (TIGR03279 family)
MKIKSIAKGSVASLHPVAAGDDLEAIDGHPIRDIIDYKFYSADHRLEIKIRSPLGELKHIIVEKQPDEDLGLQFYPIRYKSCHNKCIFCFVHQLPRGLRKALYFKDEDFRLSFLHGNFITLTNVLNNDINRIVKQRLSPLYISVHATDEELRKKILGNSNIPQIMPLIQKLAEAKIEMHTQIVLCPGINDGVYLDRSVKDLSALYPYVESLALVPVGLTKFRDKLPEIKPVSKAYSKNVIVLVKDWQRVFRERWGTGFVYAADEFFTKAELDIPPSRYYDEFHQIENGVGMMRKLLDDFKSRQKYLPKNLKESLKITLMTGVSAFRLINQLVEEKLNQIKGLKIQPVVVKNQFFGHSVTVTGLLTGVDILRTLKGEKSLGEIILLPPDCLNRDGLFLDDMSPHDLERELGRKVIVGSYDLVDTLIRGIGGWKSEN